jgi:4-hydroxy-tetrahydrodipicolinate synthase
MSAERFHGIHASTICPFGPDGAIDVPALARHLEDMAATPGMTGLLVNGHAGENFVLCREEKRRVVEIARQTVGRRLLIVAGVNAEDSREAARHAADAAQAGADALMIFPPFSWAVSQDDRMAGRHHEAVLAAADLPLFLYPAPIRSEMGYPPAVLAQLLELPRVVAIKEGSWETAAYEANRRLTKRLRPDVAVMASGDEHLFSCFVLGSEGSLVSIAAVMPEPVIALDRAVRAGDLAAARAAHARIYPLARAIYGTPPGGRATARLKACLGLLGRLEGTLCRLPLGQLPPDEIRMLEQALVAAGLK